MLTFVCLKHRLLAKTHVKNRKLKISLRTALGRRRTQGVVVLCRDVFWGGREIVFLPVSFSGHVPIKTLKFLFWRSLPYFRSGGGGCSSRVAHRARVSGAVCVGLAPLRGFQCKNLAVGQHHTEARLTACTVRVVPPCFDGTTAGQPFRHFGGRSHRGNLRPHPDVHSARCSQDSAWACWAAQITRGDRQRIGGAHHLCDVGGGAGSL